MEPPEILMQKSTSSRPLRIYKRGELLGRGAFACVYLITDSISGEKSAVKTFYKDQLVKKKLRMEKFKSEMNLHERLSLSANKNILKFKTSFENSKFSYMVLEWAELKTLKEVSIKRITITEAEARYYFTQIAAGLKFLSDQKILHRDIKLGNLMLSADMTVKIGDFGLASPVSDLRRPSRCGTPNYMSPEVVAGLGHCLESDLWSLGCVIYALLCGKPPFHAESPDTTYMLIRTLQYMIPPELSFQAAQFLRQLLDEKPTNRGNLNPPASPDSLLGHPFLSVGFTPASLPASAVFQEPDWSLVRSQRTFLERVVLHLELFLTRRSQARRWAGLVVRRKVPVYVSRWADFSDKFGFVYQLSDGGLGVLYWDGSKFTVSADRKTVRYTDLEGKDFFCTADRLDGNNNDRESQDLVQRFQNLEYYVRYMKKNLEETILTDTTIRRVQFGPSDKPSQIIRQLRTQDCVIMQLNRNAVQVNFRENHVKIIIWEKEEYGDMMATIIYTVETETGFETFSLVTDSSSEVSGERRRLISDTRERISQMMEQ